MPLNSRPRRGVALRAGACAQPIAAECRVPAAQAKKQTVYQYAELFTLQAEAYQAERWERQGESVAQ